MMRPETVVGTAVEKPTDPGFYKYSDGRQSVIFCLDSFTRWWVITRTPNMQRCEWSYILETIGNDRLVKA